MNFHKAVARRLFRRSKTRNSKISFNGQRKKREFHDTAESRSLDTFYWKLLEGTSSFKNLAEVLKIIITLSHGQASVERGFSVNKSLLVENLAPKSLIAQRIVYDHMKVSNVSAEDVEFRPTLCCSAKHARQR